MNSCFLFFIFFYIIKILYICHSYKKNPLMSTLKRHYFNLDMALYYVDGYKLQQKKRGVYIF